MDPVEDERLATFVVSSHAKNHPANADHVIETVVCKYSIGLLLCKLGNCKLEANHCNCAILGYLYDKL